MLERFIDMWRQVVRASQGATGCVVAGVAVDTAPESPDALLMGIVRETFRAWIATLADQLAERGIEAARARALATMTLAGMEGALILCRAEGDVQPLETVAAELLSLLPPGS